MFTQSRQATGDDSHSPMSVVHEKHQRQSIDPVHRER